MGGAARNRKPKQRRHSRYQQWRANGQEVAKKDPPGQNLNATNALSPAEAMGLPLKTPFSLRVATFLTIWCSKNRLARGKRKGPGTLTQDPKAGPGKS
jgi:hypothetical protein